MIYFFVGLLFGVAIGAGITVVANYETQRKRIAQHQIWGMCVNVVRQDTGEIEACLIAPNTLDEALRQDNRRYVHQVGNAPVYFSDLSPNGQPFCNGMRWGINNPSDD